MIDELIGTLSGVHPMIIYTIIGLGAAIENPVPPVPADTFVLLGAFLAARGRADPLLVFLVTWVLNVSSALGMYTLAWHYGQRFFRTAFGRRLLQPRQLDHIGRFYKRWGMPTIFVSRFLPGLRAVVPVFAGISHIPVSRVAPPVALASGLWYGLLVYLGAFAGRNWAAIEAIFARFSGILLWIAIPLLLAVAYWWWRTRHPEPH